MTPETAPTTQPTLAPITPEEGQSADLIRENIETLKRLMPEVVTEGKVDFDVLRQLLGDAEVLDEGEEKFGLNWHGKKRARQVALMPSAGTLRPCPEESVDWDTTQNLFIEGDNLEVLKLLQKSYANQVKMIYIDPPYNTGNEFIYPDRFEEGLETYLRYTGQKDENGQWTTSEQDRAGKKHTNWLNMMYPRLKLAKNLLREDGVIFISIDEIEFSNLRKICDEIFGEENHIADFVWKNKKGGGNDAKYVAVEHEYILMYAKNEVNLHELFEPYKANYLTRYKEEDERGKFFWDTFKRKSGKQYYPITCPDGTILENDEFGNKISWLRSQTRFKEDIKIGDIRILKNSGGGWSVHFKQRLPKGKKPRSVFLEESIFDSYGTTSDGSSRIFNLFNTDIFSNPKPLKLIKHLIGFSLTNDDIVLDFFAGSGTLHDATLQANQEDNGKRKVISIQLPELVSDKTEIDKNAKNMGFKTIPDISKERIRRAAAKLKEDHPDYQGDLGFKVFKLDSSNLKPWNPNPDDLEHALLNYRENILPNRSEEDVLYELLLKRGVDLASPIEKRTIAGKTVNSIGMGALFACLTESITSTDVEELAQGIVNWHEEYKATLGDDVRLETHVFFRDSAFTDDVAKTNLAAILHQQGLKHVRSL